VVLIDAAKTDGLSSRLVCASCEWLDRSVMPNMVVFHNDIGVFVAIYMILLILIRLRISSILIRLVEHRIASLFVLAMSQN
jgi:hypothetical protein